MGQLSREDLWAQLKRNELAPVYVLHGPETYLRDLAAKSIADACFGKDELRDFNETTFSLAGEHDLRAALAAARQIPMMAARRLVSVTEVRVSATGYRDTLTEADEPVLSAYLADPAPDAVVIFVADELNGVRKLGRLLRAKTASVEFKPLEDRDLIKWARRAIDDSGATADGVVLDLIVQRAGPDVCRIANEIDKLAAAAMPDGAITPELVDSLVPYSREIDNFSLTDQLISGDRARALRTLCKVLDDGVEPLALLGLIAVNYRKLLIANDMFRRGAPERDVASAVRPPFNMRTAFLSAARRSDPGKLGRAMGRMAETDLAIKTSRGASGPAGARMQIEMLVCELALI